MLKMTDYAGSWWLVMPALVASMACESSNAASGNKQGPDSVSVRMSLAEAIQSSRGSGEPVNPADVQLISAKSKIRPDLTYWWGVLRPPGSADAVYTAVLAARGNTSTLIRFSSDWQRAIGNWQPTSSASAISGCEELVNVAGPGADPFAPPLVIAESDSVLRTLGASMSRTLRASGPEALLNSRDGTWTATMWFRDRGRAARYSCRFEKGQEPRLSLLDSIPGKGLFPRGP